MLSKSAFHSASLLSCSWSPYEFLTAVKWRLSHDLSRGSLCPLYPDTALNPQGHHADVEVMLHNNGRGVQLYLGHSVNQGVKVDVCSKGNHAQLIFWCLTGREKGQLHW